MGNQGAGIVHKVFLGEVCMGGRGALLQVREQEVVHHLLLGLLGGFVLAASLLALLMDLDIPAGRLSACNGGGGYRRRM
jgi:hypothetical protein